MNCVYRLIWNDVLGAFVAVAEFARSRGKRGGTRRGAALAASLCALALTTGPAQALPTGEQVAAGSVDVARPAANELVVTQRSDQAIVNWRTFSIDTNETTRFVQPGANSVILNRVLGGDASHIFGRLQSNGIVFLSNPNGVIFARGAQVDVSGLVATTLGISDQNFLARNFSFGNAGNAGGIVNEADIKAGNGGYVALIAPTVSNAGTIAATGGSAGLAAGDKVVLDFDHDGKITFKIDVPAAAARIDNTGLIAVDGGRVVMNASAKDALMSTVLNNAGLVRARSLAAKNGEIVLDGGASGVVSVAGVLDASGRDAGQTGGSVKVLGDKVGLFAQAKIDVSGDAGGGTAAVGGNFQGRGPDRNASATYVDGAARIDADALAKGDGGTVVVWSDGATQYRGSISARGGAQGGDGGTVEVSGKSNLDFNGAVNTTAAMGKTGTLLLDPTNLRICDNGTGGCANTNVDGATPFQPNTAAGSQLSWQTIDAALAGAAVEVKTTAGFDAGQAGDIDIAAGYSYNRANDLTITAANDIAFASGANVVNAGAGGLNLAATGSGGVNLANARLATAGKVSIAAAGNLTSNGGLISAGSTASDAVTLSARDIGTATTPVAVSTAGGISLSARGEVNLGTAVSQGTRAVAATTAALNREALAVAVATKDATASMHFAGAVSPTLKVAATAVSAPAAVPPMASAPTAGENELWREIGSAVLPKDVVRLCESFLHAHPGSAHADSARAMLDGARLATASLRAANLTGDAVRTAAGNADYRADVAKAMRGDKDAAYRIAVMYRDGGGEGNARRSENWLRVAAELGNGAASRQLAQYYGTANMAAEAARYERRAIELGYGPSPGPSSRG